MITIHVLQWAEPIAALIAAASLVAPVLALDELRVRKLKGQ